jgi:lipoprotein-anchoring transpeptidase ErfK/SrfK
VQVDVGSAARAGLAYVDALAAELDRGLRHVPAGPSGAPYGDDVRSVRFLRTTVLRKAPDSTADKVGVIAKDARARVARAAAGGRGCATRWIEILPRGWACEIALAPSTDEPTPPRPASLSDDDGADDLPAVPGVYGVVRGKDVPAFASRSDALAGQSARVVTGATSVRARGVANLDGRRYWITTGGELIDAASIATISPSKFRGVALDGATTLPLAWSHGHGKPRAKVAVRDTPAPDGAITGELAPRTVVAIVEESADRRFVRVADAGWVARADLRVAALAAPPPGTGPDEKWFDVDLDEQVVVAYEGAHAVYATLVSTGKSDRRTPPGVARVVSKLESANMVSEKRDVYSVADVPWTMYYDHNFALHTAYWHDGFGDPRSHGCVNLAPRDARLLYQWSSPDVPPGWIAVYGDADTPGSLVRVRSREAPEPAFRGYARTLQDRATLTASE